MTRPRPPRLGVNIDHVATIRNARGGAYPDPVRAARIAEAAGADGITLHVREDRRHINENDLRRLAGAVHVPINLEMAATEEMLAIALAAKPHAVCLVAERREEVTTEGGLDAVGNRERVQACVDAMNAAGIKTSLFIDPEPAQIELSARIGAPWIELHTGAYADAYHGPGRAAEFQRLCAGAELGHRLGLVVNAGHGINYVNIAEVRTLPHLHELNIGHSIVSRALFVGVADAVRDMRARMNP